MPLIRKQMNGTLYPGGRKHFIDLSVDGRILFRQVSFMLRGLEVDRTGLGSSPVAGFGISSVQLSFNQLLRFGHFSGIKANISAEHNEPWFCVLTFTCFSIQLASHANTDLHLY
jgi:hypothetical protein